MGFSLRELMETQQRVKDALPYGGTLVESDPPDTIEMHWVQVTSLTQTAGRYPAKRYELDANAKTFTEKETCWVWTPNGESLNTGVYYKMRISGIRAADARVIYSIATAPTLFSGASTSTFDQVITNGSITTVAYTGTYYDTEGYFSFGSPDRLIAPQDGFYQVTGNVVWSNAPHDGFREMFLLTSRAAF